MIEAKLAFLISGGTGSGKTTLRLRHYWDAGSRQFRMAAAHGIYGMSGEAALAAAWSCGRR